MRNPARIAPFLLCFAALLASSGRIFAAGEGPGKWDESTAGRWESLPERHVGSTDNGISVEATMLPGTGVSYRRVGRWAPGSAALRFAVDNVNAGMNDYLPGEAIFPASVTFVFGNDSLTLGWRARVELFFKELWNGFTPSGIRLTYAWGNGLPVGSMYRLWEEETVFVVAGPEEGGKDDLHDPPTRRRLPRRLRSLPPRAGDRGSRERPPPFAGEGAGARIHHGPVPGCAGVTLIRTGAPRWDPSATPCAPGRTRRRRPPRRRSRRRGGRRRAR